MPIPFEQPPKLTDNSPVAQQIIAHDRFYSEKASGFKAESRRSGEKRMTASSNMQEIVEGPIKNVDIPPTWSKNTRYDDGVGTTTSFKSAGSAASINSVERNRPISQKCADEFKQLLDDNTNLSSPKMLTPSQIRSLSEVLGHAMGDNQYTNTNQYPSTAAPYFKLNNAQLNSVNGRTVLEVDGSFMSDQGKPTEIYKGILTPTGTNGDKINEFFIAAPSSADFLLQESTYRKAVKSIEWR